MQTFKTDIFRHQLVTDFVLLQTVIRDGWILYLAEPLRMSLEALTVVTLTKERQITRVQINTFRGEK